MFTEQIDTTVGNTKLFLSRVTFNQIIRIIVVNFEGSLMGNHKESKSFFCLNVGYTIKCHTIICFILCLLYGPSFTLISLILMKKLLRIVNLYLSQTDDRGNNEASKFTESVWRKNGKYCQKTDSCIQGRQKWNGI